MRVFLISANLAQTPYPIYPLGLSMVAAALQQAGHEVFQFDFLQHGQSLDELASRYDVKRATVLQNLQRYYQAGGYLDPARLLKSSHLTLVDQQRALAAFKQCGLERLSPVHDALEGQIPYEELHLLRLFLLCHGNKANGQGAGMGDNQAR